MSDLRSHPALRELVERGLIAPHPAPRLLSSGNVDRRESATRTSWKVKLPNGGEARLLLGAHLSDLARRQTAFARAHPQWVAAPVFHERLSNTEAFADQYFDGESLESLAQRSPHEAKETFALVARALAESPLASTSLARQTEWLAWTQDIESLAFWSVTERELLQTLIWPKLREVVCGSASTKRWSNGDLTSSNIMIGPRGTFRVIDCEFSSETHFYLEEGERFYALSPSARSHPELYIASLPRSGPAWHLYFWLRQLGMEIACNSEIYIARVLKERLGVIRRLAEHVLDCDLSRWSVEARPVHATLEQARWAQSSQSAIFISGWCHIPSASLYSVGVSQGNQILAQVGPRPRADVMEYFGGEPLSLASGYLISVPLADPSIPLLISATSNDGALLPLHSVQPILLPGRGPWLEDYAAWGVAFDADPSPPQNMPDGPLISILLPVYNPPLEFLRSCLESVQNQQYTNWELCVVDDASTRAGIDLALREFAGAHPRTKLILQSTNGGIAAATNDALAAATGKFIILLDHDDRLRPHALLEISRRLAQEPSLDVLYSDEEKISADGSRVMPFLKPAFSPEFLLRVMYVGHLLCVRTEVANAISGFSSEYDGIQDYEFFLRLTQVTRRIAHLPRILYQWRQSESSSALHGNVKGDMDSKQVRAVNAFLLRTHRQENAFTLRPHRLELESRSLPTTDWLHLRPDINILTALYAAAQNSLAVVLIVSSAEPLSSSEDWIAHLAQLAVLPDSGLVAPVILFRDGRVRESGWTHGDTGFSPIMRGFAAEGDGYNGSLACSREVGAVAPLCFAIARQTALEYFANYPGAGNWTEFCLRLRSSRFHRVCSRAKVMFPDSADDIKAWQPTVLSADPFFNSYFDTKRADYSLARPPVV